MSGRPSGVVLWTITDRHARRTGLTRLRGREEMARAAARPGHHSFDARRRTPTAAASRNGRDYLHRHLPVRRRHPLGDGLPRHPPGLRQGRAAQARRLHVERVGRRLHRPRSRSATPRRAGARTASRPGPRRGLPVRARTDDARESPPLSHLRNHANYLTPERPRRHRHRRAGGRPLAAHQPLHLDHARRRAARAADAALHAAGRAAHACPLERFGGGGCGETRSSTSCSSRPSAWRCCWWR